MHHWMFFLRKKRSDKTPDLPVNLLLSVYRWFSFMMFVLGPIFGCLLAMAIVLLVIGTR